MPSYRVNIDGRVYEGQYDSKTNATFGAMRKDQIDRAHELGWHAWKVEEAQPTLIGVEAINDRKVAKKIHRVPDAS